MFLNATFRNIALSFEDLNYSLETWILDFLQPDGDDAHSIYIEIEKPYGKNEQKKVLKKV